MSDLTSFVLNERETRFASRMERGRSDLSRSIRHQDIFEPQPGNFGPMDYALRLRVVLLSLSPSRESRKKKKIGSGMHDGLRSLSMGTYERRFRRAFFIKSSIFQRNRRFSQSRIRTFLDPFLTFFFIKYTNFHISGLIVDQMTYHFHI